jgi:hypothetical protein
MDLIDQRTAEAIAVESQALAEVETEEARETLDTGDSLSSLGLQLSPTSWANIENVPDGFGRLL